MKNKLLIIFIVLFVNILGQTKIDSLDSNDSLKISEAISNKTIAQEKPDTSSAIPDIMLDSEVKQKLSDFFSISKVIWALIFILISFYGINFSLVTVNICFFNIWRVYIRGFKY